MEQTQSVCLVVQIQPFLRNEHTQQELRSLKGYFPIKPLTLSLHTLGSVLRRMSHS